MQRRGHYPGDPQPTYVPGLEAAGTVNAVGEDADREVGERVVAMTNEAYAEYTTAGVDALFDVPERMSFEEAAGFPVQFLTAHNTLFAPLKKTRCIEIYRRYCPVSQSLTQRPLVWKSKVWWKGKVPTQTPR